MPQSNNLANSTDLGNHYFLSEDTRNLNCGMKVKISWCRSLEMGVQWSRYNLLQCTATTMGKSGLEYKAL